ncbi:hypothetical protein ACFV0Z_10585 [Streptomyces xiamenensis]|uniref:hypothetical protein n=1 Tax=Streptomyces xiamenensis TaxID=408015 RepID=UPI003693EC17
MGRSTRRALAAVGILTGVLVVGALAGMAMALASDSEDSGVITHTTDEDPQDVLDYWTPERIRDAEPAPMPIPD